MAEEEFNELRPPAFAIAYRMLGSVSEAEMADSLSLIEGVRVIARAPAMSLRRVEVNCGPGALFLDAQDRLIGVWALDVAGGQTTSFSSIFNPDKLAHLGPVSDVSSLLGSAR